jgi:hypothetical protein
MYKNDSITYYSLVFRSNLNDFQAKASNFEESSDLWSINIGTWETVTVGVYVE